MDEKVQHMDACTDIRFFDFCCELWTLALGYFSISLDRGWDVSAPWLRSTKLQLIEAQIWGGPEEITATLEVPRIRVASIILKWKKIFNNLDSFQSGQDVGKGS